MYFSFWGIEEMSNYEADESDKHLEARDRRYSCLKYVNEIIHLFAQRGVFRFLEKSAFLWV